MHSQTVIVEIRQNRMVRSAEEADHRPEREEAGVPVNVRRKTGPRDPLRGALYRAGAPMIRRTNGAVANGQWRTDKRKGRGVLGRIPRCGKGGTDRLVVTNRRSRRRVTEERKKGEKCERGWRRVRQRPVEHLGDITSSSLPTALCRHIFVPRLASLILRTACDCSSASDSV